MACPKPCAAITRVFKTIAFQFTLKLLGVNQQFTELHSPWQNGRMGRFWRTLKETLSTEVRRFTSGVRVLEEQLLFASVQAMQEVLEDFRLFYNFSRPHQSLKGQTPAQVWQAQVDKRKLGGKNNKKPNARARDRPR
jgi:putative transposase